MAYNTSAVIITWNEECIIRKCLDYLETLPSVGEIVIVDNFSTDKTVEIINDFKATSGKEVKLIQKIWEGQDAQWNTGIDNSKYKWILWLAADETFSREMAHLLLWVDTDAARTINAVRIPTLVTYPDDRHYVLGCNEENHTRLFRRGLARFKGKSMEDLFDAKGRSILWTGASDIMNCGSIKGGGPLFKCTFRHHHQLLKTKDSLQAKGVRWEELGVFKEAAEKGMPIHRNTWVDGLEYAPKHRTAPIPEEWM